MPHNIMYVIIIVRIGSESFSNRQTSHSMTPIGSPILSSGGNTNMSDGKKVDRHTPASIPNLLGQHAPGPYQRQSTISDSASQTSKYSTANTSSVAAFQKSFPPTKRSSSNDTRRTMFREPPSSTTSVNLRMASSDDDSKITKVSSAARTLFGEDFFRNANREAANVSS